MSDEASGGIQWKTLFQVLAAVGGIAYFLPPVTSPRPPAPPAVPGFAVALQRVEARLWDDPFHPFAEKGRANPAVTPEQLNGFLSDDDAPLLLMVMMPGSPYSEDIETRRRMRYAVASALSTASQHFVPEEGDHLGELQVPGWDRYDQALVPSRRLSEIASIAPIPPAAAANISVVQSGENRGTVLIPFERWRWQGKGISLNNDKDPLHRPVTVLWLREELFADHPLHRLAHLLDGLGLPDLPNAQPVLIGPHSSTTLRGMFKEQDPRASFAGSDRSRFSLLKTVRVLSPTATASDAVLTFSIDDSPAGANSGEVAKTLGNVFKSFARTTTTDDRQVAALISDLRLRGVKVEGRVRGNAAGAEPARDGEPIVLVSESDTLYGRALPIQFAAQASGQNIRDVVLNDGNWPTWIRRLSYLRGIDGQLPGDAKPKEEDRKYQPIDWQKFQTADRRTLPEGQNASDYLDRLVEQLVELDGQERARASGSGIRAVGILGSDPYDKLMILRALRPRLQDVLFFTTDLDARYAQPEEFAWTHNLIVASPFGLELTSAFPIGGAAGNTNLQGGIAPFRDGYQTAVFFATKAALDPALLTDDPWDNPRLYEIGRTHAVDLSLPETAGIGMRRTLHPDPDSHGVSLWYRTGFWVAIAACLLVALIPSQPRVRVVCKQYQTLFRVLVGGLLTLILLCYVIYRINDGPHGEPLFLSEGVSVWPTEFIRFLATVLGGVFLWLARSDLQAKGESLAKRYSLRGREACRTTPGVWGAFRLCWAELLCGDRRKNDWPASTYWSSPPTQPAKDLKARDDRIYPKLCGGDPQPPVGEQWVDAKELWRAYTRRSQFRYRGVRVTSWCLAYLGLGVCLMLLFGVPNIPARGQVAFAVDRAALVASTAMLVILTFYMVDVSQMCQRFVKYLARSQTWWPRPLQCDATVARHMRPEHLDDLHDIQLIAEWTEVVAGVVSYPVVVLVLMGLARSRYFDDWTWPTGLILIYSLNVMYCAASYFALRGAAEEARKTGVDRLTTRLRALNHSSDSADAAEAERVRQVVQEIKDIRRGVFQPFWQQPVVRASLFPLSVFGLWALTQYISNFY